MIGAGALVPYWPFADYARHSKLKELFILTVLLKVQRSTFNLRLESALTPCSYIAPEPIPYIYGVTRQFGFPSKPWSRAQLSSRSVA